MIRNLIQTIYGVEVDEETMKEIDKTSKILEDL